MEGYLLYQGQLTSSCTTDWTSDIPSPNNCQLSRVPLWGVGPYGPSHIHNEMFVGPVLCSRFYADSYSCRKFMGVTAVSCLEEKSFCYTFLQPLVLRFFLYSVQRCYLKWLDKFAHTFYFRKIRKTLEGKVCIVIFQDTVHFSNTILIRNKLIIMQ